MQWRFAGLSHPGRVRKQNEDAFSLKLAPHGVFILADGLGGHQGGATASRLTVECLEERLGTTPTEGGCSEPNRLSIYLQEAILQASQEIYNRSLQDPSLSGMGCTLLVALLRDQRLLIAHVGDVRGYLWRENKLQQLTSDHSEVAHLVAKGYLSAEEARFYPFRHRIERAVGLSPELAVETRDYEVQIGDRLLFCSDGLWNMLEDAKLSSLLNQERNLESCAVRLEEEANAAGGEDNLTLILVDLID